VSLEAAERIRIGSADLQVRRIGDGPPLLFLHGEDGLLFAGPLLTALAEHFEVIAPSHPGWAGSARPSYVRTLDDIAYLYLDLLEGIGEGIGAPVALVGVSIGGWLAAEVATKSEHHLSCLVLASPLGVKSGGRLDRTFLDLYATAPDKLQAALYGDPNREPDRSALSQQDFLELAIAEEAVTRYGWEPYLHNPQLPHRLGRIRRPTLIVAGSDDRFVLAPGYYESYAALIGSNAEVAVIAGAGHRLDEEVPDELGRRVVGFVRQCTGQD
jgi:pimeloyl-ACP methyl ester carboxylesterase